MFPSIGAVGGRVDGSGRRRGPVSEMRVDEGTADLKGEGC